MAGKVTVNGEQNSYSGKWIYNINTLDAWMVHTQEKFGESGLTALAALVKQVTFTVEEKSTLGDGLMLFTDVRYGNIQVCIEKEELDKFCIKL